MILWPGCLDKHTTGSQGTWTDKPVLWNIKHTLDHVYTWWFLHFHCSLSFIHTQNIRHMTNWTSSARPSDLLTVLSSSHYVPQRWKRNMRAWRGSSLNSAGLDGSSTKQYSNPAGRNSVTIKRGFFHTVIIFLTTLNQSIFKEACFLLKKMCHFVFWLHTYKEIIEKENFYDLGIEIPIFALYFALY